MKTILVKGVEGVVNLVKCLLSNGVVKVRWSKMVFAVLMGLTINSLHVLAQPETLCRGIRETKY